MPANISRWSARPISGRRTRYSRCRNPRSTRRRTGSVRPRTPLHLSRLRGRSHRIERCDAGGGNSLPTGSMTRGGTPTPALPRKCGRGSAVFARLAGRPHLISQRHSSSFFGGPIAGVVDLDGLERQREVRKRLPPGRDAFHEILDFLQVPAGPFFLQAEILPAGLSIDLFGDCNGG